MASPAIPRTVANCERYLAILARVAKKSRDDAAWTLPLYRRLKRELAEARAEEEGIAELLKHLA